MRARESENDLRNVAATFLHIKRDISSVRSLGFKDVWVEESNGENGGKIIFFDLQEKVPTPTK